MKESTRVGLCQLIPSSCFVNSYEDLSSLSTGSKVSLWLRDTQHGKHLVVAEVVFNGLLNEVYDKDYFDLLSIKSCWVKHISANDFVEYYPLILKYNRIDKGEIAEEYCFADCLDVLRLNEHTEKYSTNYVEYWNGTQFNWD